MRVKTIVTVILGIVISCSCSIRSKYNLEEAISKNAPDVIGENHYEAIDREMVTHQPAFEIRNDLLEYRFGDIAFTDNSGGNFIRLIVNSANERKIIGVLINIGNNLTEGDKMKSYLDRTFDCSRTDRKI